MVMIGKIVLLALCQLGSFGCFLCRLLVLRQTVCLVVNPIKVDNFAFLFNCTPAGQTSDSMMVPIVRSVDERVGA